MNNQTAPQSVLRSWREIYTAALFETDNNRIPVKIVSRQPETITAPLRLIFHHVNTCVFQLLVDFLRSCEAYFGPETRLRIDANPSGCPHHNLFRLIPRRTAPLA